MKMRETAIIVGAGASTEFGAFPVGSELAEKIENQLIVDLSNRDGPIINTISSHGGFNQIHRAAMTRIINGLQSRDSIDQFVDDCKREPGLIDVAKIAIAYCIIEAEKSSPLKDLDQVTNNASLRNLRNTWLGRLCRISNPDVSPEVSSFIG